MYSRFLIYCRHFSIGIDGLNNSILSDLVLRYSPEYYTFLANSTNVVFNNFDISGYSSSSNEAKNTDGWDTYRSTDISILDSVINNGDGKLQRPTASSFPQVHKTHIIHDVFRVTAMEPCMGSPPWH